MIAKTLCRLALGLMPFILFAACSDIHADDEPDYEPDAIQLVTSDLTAPPQGGRMQIAFTCSGDWTLQTSPDTKYNNGQFSRTSGTKNESVIDFTALPNTGGQTRVTAFTLTCGRASVAVEIKHPPMEYGLTSEAAIKEMLLKLYDDTDGDNWRFKVKWDADIPLSQWGSAVKYNNGELELYLNENNLCGEIDLSGCTALKTLRVSKNKLTRLNLSGCTRLETVDATSNELKEVRVEGCHSLVKLMCGYNPRLSHIDVARHYRMEELRVSDCDLSDIDLTDCISLQTLSVANNRLTQLNVSERARIRDLFCYSNRIEALDVSNSPWLGLLNCGDNALTSLDVRGCGRLGRLFCYENLLSVINLTDQQNVLFELYCYTNRLSQLDICGFVTLSTLHCSDNDLRQLDVSGCKSLSSLYASYNYLEALKVSDEMSFVTLDLTRNRLSQIPLERCHYGAKVYCMYNPVCSEIPEHADSFETFEHDARYEYGPGGIYTDRGYGWWFAGEPQSGKHRR